MNIKKSTKLNPCVIWITGLSGSGKTSLANEVYKVFKNDNFPVVYFDGDILRNILGFDPSDQTNNTRKKRLKIAMCYSKLCQNISSQGVSVIIATISMFREIYIWNKKYLPNYFEVYLKVPIDVLKKRDPKNIYKKYLNGEIKNVAGLDLEVDEPLHPFWKPKFNSSKNSFELAKELLIKLNKGK